MTATTTTSVSTYQMFIDGQWVNAASGGTFDSLNPYTGEVWAKIPDGQDADVDRAVTAAQRALADPEWKGMGPTRRGLLMRHLGELISQNADHLGHVETRDNGKLIREMLSQAARGYSTVDSAVSPRGLRHSQTNQQVPRLKKSSAAARPPWARAPAHTAGSS